MTACSFWRAVEPLASLSVDPTTNEDAGSLQPERLAVRVVR